MNENMKKTNKYELGKDKNKNLITIIILNLLR
jgi:hypothetical protein